MGPWNGRILRPPAVSCVAGFAGASRVHEGSRLLKLLESLSVVAFACAVAPLPRRVLYALPPWMPDRLTGLRIVAGAIGSGVLVSALAVAAG